VDQQHIERTLLRGRLLPTRGTIRCMGLRALEDTQCNDVAFFTNATPSLGARD
jgi:hypothetical protein